MLLWLVLPARADEPIVVLDPARAGAPALARREGVLPWDTVGFVKAAPDGPRSVQTSSRWAPTGGWPSTIPSDGG